MPQKEKKDIANSTEVYPVIIANPIFRNLHKELIFSIGQHMEMIGMQRDILLLGLSPLASPYGDNLNWFLETLGPKGRVVAIDYNVKVIAKAAVYLLKKGFFNKMDPLIVLRSAQSRAYLMKSGLPDGLRRHVRVSKGGINPKKLKARTFVMVEGNLNYALPLPKNSFDCVDATLTLHHVAAYRQQIKNVLEEIYRVLKPNGMLHYGDAFVDMRASETKINKIMNEMSHLTGKDMVLYDTRDSDWKVFAEYSASRSYEEVPLLHVTRDRPKTKKPVVEITPDGLINIEISGSPDIYVRRLEQMGYYDKMPENKSIVMPLIDQNMEKQHIRNVNEFQDLVKELKKGLYAITNFCPELIDAAIARGDIERENSLKGLFEYFSSREFIIKLLHQVGYINLSSMHPNKGTNYPVDVGAILAYKPK